MGKMSRTKGGVGERELINEILDQTGIRLERNLAQSFGGGHDLIGLDEWAIECKRYASIGFGDKRRFWAQTVEQAKRVDKRPVLCFREDRQPWRVVLNFTESPELYDVEDYNSTCEISLELFCGLIREGL